MPTQNAHRHLSLGAHHAHSLLAALVRALRAWYYLRELLGHPRRLDSEEFEKAPATVLLAGSPWRRSTTSTNGPFYVTHTSWTHSTPPPNYRA